MSNEQKLREAFEAHMTDGGKWPNAILKAPGGQYLLLRTSVAWQDWKACAEALTLPTAAPVDERETFEALFRERYGWDTKDFKRDSRGDYMDGNTVTAWMSWQARAALQSSADVGDAERYRWLADCNNYYEAINLIADGSLTEDALGKAIDAAIRARSEGGV